MAFDKNQLVMHQLQVKSKRLESGLLEIVGALLTHIPDCTVPKDVIDAYDYALGCLGGDFLKKDLFAKDSFGRVVERLRDNKFMRHDIAEKNLSVWNRMHVHSCDTTSHSTTGTESIANDSETVASVGNVNESNAKVAGDNCVDDKPSTTLGTVDENGDIVPVNREQKCEFAEVPSVESKSGVQPAGIVRSGQEVKRGPIYCY